MFKDLRAKQSFTIASITFWSQFAVYSFQAILILYLTRSVKRYGLGFDESQAYAFQGASHAMMYAVVMLGGFMADRYLGLRRAILLGSLLLAFSFLLIFISGFFVESSRYFFIAAYALIPAASSLLLGTSSGLVSKIYSDDPLNAKSAMTTYYISINVGSILAFSLAPWLMQYEFGPLTVLLIVFVGKLISAVNFLYRYKMYDNVVEEIDKNKMPFRSKMIVISYLVVIYITTLLAYSAPNIANMSILFFSIVCLFAFLFYTMTLDGHVRIKQIVGLILIVVAVVFFVVYNQMNSTMVLLAQNNSDLMMFGVHINAAAYQLVNPFVIILGGLLLVLIYPYFPRFCIPYQFAVGILLSSVGMYVVYFGLNESSNGIISGNYLVWSYILVSISELFVSAIGLSMIGSYCNIKTIGLAMGAWYISNALSSSITGLLNQVVSLPSKGATILKSAHMYKIYFLNTSIVVLLIGCIVCVLAYALVRYMKSKEVSFI